MNLKEPYKFMNTVYRDERGSFRELLNITNEPWNSLTFIQQNISRNREGVLRGLHYQHKHPQGKLVTVLHGHVYDFVLDLRTYSSNFGKIEIFALYPDVSLWVPPGFAHGFISNEEDTIFSYNVFGHPRMADDEYSIHPLQFIEIKDHIYYSENVIMSEKDQKGLSLLSAPVYRNEL